MSSTAVNTQFLSGVTLPPTKEEKAARIQQQKIEQAFADFRRIFPNAIQGLISEYYLNEWMLQLDPQTFKPGSLSFLMACYPNPNMAPYLSMPDGANLELPQKCLQVMTAVREDARYLEMPNNEPDPLALVQSVVEERGTFEDCVVGHLKREQALIEILCSSKNDKITYTYLSLLPQPKTTILSDYHLMDPTDPEYGPVITPLGKCTQLRISTISPRLPHFLSKMTDLEYLSVKPHPSRLDDSSLTQFPTSLTALKKLQVLDVTCSIKAMESLLPLLPLFKKLTCVTLTTIPTSSRIPEELDQLKKQNSKCQIIWNDTVVTKASSDDCVIS